MKIRVKLFDKDGYIVTEHRIESDKLDKVRTIVDDGKHYAYHSRGPFTEMKYQEVTPPTKIEDLL